MVARLGVRAAAGTAGLAALALGLGITTPPRSGTYCRAHCVVSPYTDIAEYVPRDYLWMYPAILAPLAFVVLAVCVHFWVSAARRPFSAVGICFAVLAASVLTVDYAIQLFVVQASLRAGEATGLSLISQYNPHGVFIGLENLGYAVLGLAFVPLGLALVTAVSRPARAAGWVFVGGGGVTLALLVVLSAVYRFRLEYLFEVLGLLVGYLVLITAGVLVGIGFARERDPGANGGPDVVR